MRETSLDEFVDPGEDGDDADPDDETTGDISGETADGDAGAAETTAGSTTTGAATTASEGQDEPPAADESGAAAGAAAEGDPDEDTAVEPAVSTLDWRPGRAPCAACGESVERRWRDDGELVCSSCKTW